MKSKQRTYRKLQLLENQRGYIGKNSIENYSKPDVIICSQWNILFWDNTFLCVFRILLIAFLTNFEFSESISTISSCSLIPTNLWLFRIRSDFSQDDWTLCIIYIQFFICFDETWLYGPVPKFRGEFEKFEFPALRISEIWNIQ